MCCRKLSPALLREGLSLFLCVPIMSQVLRTQHDVCRCSTPAKDVICWWIRLNVRLSAEQHEKPDAPCRVRRRVGPARRRPWTTYPSKGFSKTRATLKAARQSVVYELAGPRACSLPNMRAVPIVQLVPLLADSTNDRRIARFAYLRAGEECSAFPRSRATCDQGADVSAVRAHRPRSLQMLPAGAQRDLR